MIRGAHVSIHTRYIIICSEQDVTRPETLLNPSGRGEVRGALNDQLPQVLLILRQVRVGIMHQPLAWQSVVRAHSCTTSISVWHRSQALEDGRGSAVHVLAINALKAWVEFGLPWEYVLRVAGTPPPNSPPVHH
jgi:hypothetical protein